MTINFKTNCSKVFLQNKGLKQDFRTFFKMPPSKRTIKNSWSFSYKVTKINRRPFVYSNHQLQISTFNFIQIIFIKFKYWYF